MELRDPFSAVRFPPYVPPSSEGSAPETSSARTATASSTPATTSAPPPLDAGTARAALDATTRSDEASVDRERSAKIAAFYAGYTMHAKGPNGSCEFVVPFRMNHGPDDQKSTWDALAKALAFRGNHDRATTTLISHIASGRASQAELRDCIAQLSARHPEHFASPLEARTYLASLGVGVDCAGTVQQCLRATLGPNAYASLGLRSLMNEDLSGLPSDKHFTRIADASAARPGDVMTLNDPDGGVGHAVIVVAKRTHLADVDEVARAKAAGIELHVGDSVTELDVASSWGGVGPKTATFTQLGSGGAWATLERGKLTASGRGAAGPYDHDLVGIFRAKVSA